MQLKPVFVIDLGSKLNKNLFELDEKSGEDFVSVEPYWCLSINSNLTVSELHF